LPPLNGFVSEWLAFQAILVSPQLSSWGLKLMIPAAGALLALSAALAGACFVRVYGIAFLGRPRSDAAGSAHEIERVSIVAIRSSYNGLLVFLFITASGMIGAFAIHRLASDKIRRSAIWDCGFPDPSPATQYTADSFAQPIRRIFGTLVFRARELGETPTPNSTAPARFVAVVHDPIWDTLYAPLVGFVAFAAEKLN